MFRVGVAALVFVGSFHPPVQSKWFHKAERTASFSTAEFTRKAPVFDRHEKLTARASDHTTGEARP